MLVRSNSSFYPYIVLGLSACFLFYKYILQVYPSIMVSDLMNTFDIEATGVGILSGCFFYTYVIVQIFAGMLIDRLNLRHLTTAAIIIAASGLLIFSSANSFVTAQMARGLMGAGAAFITVNYLKIASMLFPPQNFALLAGLMASSAMLGAMFGTTVLSHIVLQYGWRNTLLGCGIMGVILAMAFWSITKEDHRSSIIKPATKVPFFQGLQSILKNKQNWIISLYCGLTFTPLNVFISLWGLPFLQEAYGLSPLIAVQKISFAFIGFAIGAPLLGWLSAYLDSRYEIIAMGCLSVFLTLSLIIYFPAFLGNFLNFLLFLFGFSTSSFMLGFDIARELNSKALIATTIAFINSFEALCSGMLEPLIGILLDFWAKKEADHSRIFTTTNYQIALFMLIILPIISLFLLKFIKDIDEPKKG